MTKPAFDAVVIGAGQAGLGISYCLKQHGLHHTVLERGRIGETWRTQRWDSFALNSPNWLNMLPGDPYRGANPNGFDTAPAFVRYLQGYADRYRLPVQVHARVVSVERKNSAYRVTASVRGTTRSYGCRQVVVASGAMNKWKVPPFAKALSANVRQCHAGEYRSPAELPEGAVLVVGGAQSGLQVAEDLIAAGKRVYLSTSAVGRVPRRYRGKDILEWHLRVGILDLKTEDITDPQELEMKLPQVSGVGPLGHTLSLQSLAGRGAVIVGKIESVYDTAINLQPNAAEHIRFGDEVSRKTKAMIEKFITENSLDVPPPEPDPADEPDTGAASASSVTSLDLKRENIRSIIWATGFSADFSYLNGQGLDGNGSPVHRNGISNVTGLYFVGLPWLRKRKSGIIHGVAEDAAFVAENVASAIGR